MYRIITLLMLIINESAMARSLVQSANAAKSAFTTLGVTFASLGIIFAGILFVFGNQRAPSWMTGALIGTAIIVGAGSIVAFVQGFAG